MSTDAAVVKPEHVFDRESEWRALVAFTADDSRGATLGVVAGGGGRERAFCSRR